MGKKENNKKKWDKTSKRFVAFFDIMGFKELVTRYDHKTVLGKLELLNDTIASLKNHNYSPGLSELMKTKIDETRAITFSDSIVFFTKGDTIEDVNKILTDAYSIIASSFENEIPIKGALSYGEITVDFKNSLFFGQPIIDAYQLHDQLQLYTAVIDNHFEKRIASMDLSKKILSMLHNYKTPFKGGKITHKLIGPVRNHDEYLKYVGNIGLSVSGNPRIYVDNTIDFLNHIKSGT